MSINGQILCNLVKLKQQRKILKYSLWKEESIGKVKIHIYFAYRLSEINTDYKHLKTQETKASARIGKLWGIEYRLYSKRLDEKNSLA